MILLLDQGNSRLKWQLVGAGGAAFAGGTGLEGAVRKWRSGLHGVPLSSILLASVRRKEEVDALLEACREAFGIAPEQLFAVAECAGLKNGYDEPRRLGVDRWLAMLGGCSRGLASFLVVDAGTAVTVDAVAHGVHLGGYILPGLAMQRTSLGIGTARVGSAEGRATLGWGRDTGAAVLNGTARAVAELASAALIELQGVVGDTCPLLVTGGDGRDLVPLLRAGPVSVEDDLVFRGMVAQWDAIAARG